MRDRQCVCARVCEREKDKERKKRKKNPYVIKIKICNNLYMGGREKKRKAN
jgi:hypothetical protein